MEPKTDFRKKKNWTLTPFSLLFEIPIIELRESGIDISPKLN